MAAHYFNTIENNSTGKPVVNASVAVLTGPSADGGASVTIYSDEGLSIAASNPVITDSLGFFEFYTDVSEVCLEVSYNGETQRVIENVQMIGGSVSGDVTALSARMDTAEADIAALKKYIFSLFVTSTPTASEVLCLHVAGVSFTIPANFSGGLRSSIGTNPTSSFALDVQNNGTTIGTITVATGGTVTATTASGTSKSIAAGDVIKIVAPSTADATAANMAFTIIGAR